ncbi:MAG: lysophospholipid acyltransferase family protein [Novosphingobium sp.]
MTVRPGDVLRSLAFYAVFYGVTLVLLVLAVLVRGIAPGKVHVVPHLWCAFHRGCVRKLLGIRVVVEGELPQGQILAAIKHESFFEALDVPNLLAHPAIFAKVELLRIPLWGWVADRYGIVAVERDQGAKALRKMIAAAQSLSEQGRPLVIFPEGTRVRHGECPPLQAGFAGLYKLLVLPVVPLAVDSGPLYHRLWKRRGTITIRIGAPIPPGLPRAEIEQRVHAAINALNPDPAR